MTHEKELWSLDLFASLHDEFVFTLDAYAVHGRAKVDRYFAPDEDGLAEDWSGERVWCMPPSDDVMRWVRKAGASALQGSVCVFLLSVGKGTKAWREIVSHASEVRAIHGRLANALDGAEFPPVLVIFRPPRDRPEQLRL